MSLLLHRDHDDETSVIEAVGKLNQVKGVKGMRRFFKQIAQSARDQSHTFINNITFPHILYTVQIIIIQYSIQYTLCSVQYIIKYNS